VESGDTGRAERTCELVRIERLMNAGLTNLDTLRKNLLAGSLAGQVQFDEVIKDIGLGICGMMENYCNRKFARVVGDRESFQGDRASFVLPRYPIEEVTAVETRLTSSDAFVVKDLSLIQSVSEESGVVYLPDNSDSGPYWSKVRFTYTGGFWFETLEPDDENYPSAQPAGTTALPYDLRLAWLLQCREVWNKIDKLGMGTVDKPDQQTLLSALGLSESVKQTLQNYVQMTPV
jgi:hypothetical protein